MLVLSRKVGQRIMIGDDISITVTRVGQGSVRIGVIAPRDMEIVREELKTRVAVPAVECDSPEDQNPV